MKSADEIAEECRMEAGRLMREGSELIEMALILEGRHGATILSDPKYAASRARGALVITDPPRLRRVS